MTTGVAHKTFEEKVMTLLPVVLPIILPDILPDILPPVELTPDQLAEIASHVDVTNKVDKVQGKGLSTNDYTDEDKQKVAQGIGGSSGILDCGDFNSGSEGIFKIDLGGF